MKRRMVGPLSMAARCGKINGTPRTRASRGLPKWYRQAVTTVSRRIPIHSDGGAPRMPRSALVRSRELLAEGRLGEKPPRVVRLGHIAVQVHVVGGDAQPGRQLADKLGKPGH